MIDFPPNLLPSRPMKATRSVFTGAGINFFAALIMLALGLGLAIWQAPGIWRDIQISQNPIEVADFDILDGECRTQRAIFTSCEADLVYTYDGKTIESHTSFAFIDFSTSDYYVGVVISGDRPAMATLDLGLDMLWNRIAVGAGFVLLFVVLFIVALRAYFRAARDNGRAKRGGTVTPVAVEMTQNSKVLGGRVVGYRIPATGKGKRAAAAARFKKNQGPIILNGADGNVYAVGALMEGIDNPILLDEELTRLDFSEDERAAFNARLDEGSASFEAEPEAKPA